MLHDNNISARNYEYHIRQNCQQSGSKITLTPSNSTDELGKLPIIYRGAIIWNSLPSEIRNINFYVQSFQKVVKIMLPNDTLLYNFIPGGWGVLKIVLYREAPPRGPTPYPFKYNFFSEKTPLSYNFYWKNAPLSYTFSLARLMNKSLKQELFLSFFFFFFHVALNKLK